MAERVREIMKRSTSKLSTSKGSVTHIGTSPYRFKIVLFISYAENIKSISEACISWERRGKVQATNSVKVKDGRAVFRQALSMECTLFRKSASSKSKQDKAQTEELQFDEKKAKMYLRKGGPQGKAVAKLSLNISDYIKGASSTVFADMKLSDGTLVVTKVEATMIALEKKKKSGSRTGSEVASEFSDGNSVDDSLFGDEEDLENAKRMTDVPSLSLHSPSKGISSLTSHMSPVTCSSTGSHHEDTDVMDRQLNTIGSQNRVPDISPDSTRNELQTRGMLRTPKQRVVESEQMKESPSFKDKLRSKLKVTGKKEKAEKQEKVEKAGKPQRTDQKSTEEIAAKDKRLSTLQPSVSGSPKHSASNSLKHSVSVSLKRSPSTASGDPTFEVKELKKMVEFLKKENSKLKKAKSAAMEEIEALRNDLKTCEEALEAVEDSDNKVSSKIDAKVSELQGRIKRKEKKIAALEAQNTNLLEEMEEQHEEMKTLTKQVTSVQPATDTRVGTSPRVTAKEIAARDEELKASKKQIAELKVALQREPEFMDVVEELKEAKINLALANMDREQALFELQNYRN